MTNLCKGIGTHQRMQYRRFEVKEHTGKFKIYAFLWIIFKIFTYGDGFTRYIKSETAKTAHVVDNLFCAFVVPSF